MRIRNPASSFTVSRPRSVAYLDQLGNFILLYKKLLRVVPVAVFSCFQNKTLGSLNISFGSKFFDP
jgi:hypothetical protein